MNGQNFAFNGYLPVKPEERRAKIRKLEQISRTTGQSQIFIETPYRNNSLLADILNTCQPETRLCLAAQITLPDSFIVTRSVAGWKRDVPDLNKKPCVFIL
jgi:16S rRNA (cytidine1402-2'-O)-methyltransferase